MPSGTLQRYDLLILRRSLSQAIATRRDQALLVFVFGLGTLWFWSRLFQWRDQIAALPAWAVAALPLIVGALVETGIRRRLRHLSDSSVLAEQALAPGARASYRLSRHMLGGLLAALPAALFLSTRSGDAALLAAPLFLGAYLLGAMLSGTAGALVRASAGHLYTWRMRRGAATPATPHPGSMTAMQRLAGLIFRRQAFFRTSTKGAVTVVLLAALAAAAVGAGTARSPDARVAPIAFALAWGLGSVVFGRLDTAVIRYSAVAGLSAVATVAAFNAALGLFTLAGLAAVSALSGSGFTLNVAIIGMMSGLVALLNMVRILYYRIKAKRLADLLIMAEAVPLALLAVFLPPLAPLALIVRLTFLWRASERVKWLAP